MKFSRAADAPKIAADLMGATTIGVPLRADWAETAADWKLDLDELDDALTERTKLLVLNTPHNPTGKVFSREELETIARVVRDENRNRLPGDELLVVYSHAANEAEARAPSSEGWQDNGKYVGMYLRRDVEGKKATARVVAHLPSTASDPYIVDGTPRELWRVQYLDSQLKGDTQDLEEEELECSEPSWKNPATVQPKKKKPAPPNTPARIRLARFALMCVPLVAHRKPLCSTLIPWRESANLGSGSECVAVAVVRCRGVPEFGRGYTSRHKLGREGRRRALRRMPQAAAVPPSQLDRDRGAAQDRPRLCRGGSRLPWHARHRQGDARRLPSKQQHACARHARERCVTKPKRAITGGVRRKTAALHNHTTHVASRRQ